ncbi:MAG: 4'-phosphopantetheinyl transferase superfamily protein [Pyrinomonadaceae bacterium]|nr:4'-phosphopantetheinyl transferase superfamily protein [Pyrinomonadaceae bacterium]
MKFNVSHTDKISLLAFTKETEIGVDLERLDRKIEVEEIAKRFFAPAEIRRLLALPSERRPIGFFNCWTRKEAIIKALGTGLAMPLDKYEVSLSSKSEKVKLIETHGGQEDVQEWSLFSLAPKPGYVGAVALKGPVEDLKCWSWR